VASDGNLVTLRGQDEPVFWVVLSSHGAGKSYALETKPTLGDGDRTLVETVSGTGDPHHSRMTPDGAGGSFRVVQQP
jgi:hypothetical protein